MTVTGQQQISSESLFNELRSELSLRQLSHPIPTQIIRSSGQQHPNTAPVAKKKMPLVGPLNAIRPSQIQLVSSAEASYLNDLPSKAVVDLCNQLHANGSAILILVEDTIWPEQHQQALEILPVFASPLGSDELIRHLQNFLNDHLNEPMTVHGALLEVHSTGLLITGPSGIGKSELALELISRGHRYVADDSPFLRRDEQNAIHGSCPAPLTGFLEVRGLGVLNVRQLFGEAAIRSSQRVDLIVDLQRKKNLRATQPEERLTGRRAYRTLLDIEVPSITIPVVAGRNLAVLVEAAAHDFQLRQAGYNAADELIRIHGQMMNSSG